MWEPPRELPDLRRVNLISIDTETRDERLQADKGSGWATHSGHLCGISIGWRGEAGIQAIYCPLQHPYSQIVDPDVMAGWLRDHIAAGVRFIAQNGLYDWGWLRTELGIRMPPGEQLEEIGALATLIDENRYQYGLDALCQWRGLAGKDDTLLREGIATLDLPKSRRKLIPQNYIWQLPAHFVGPYAEADAIGTLALFESLNPILDQEGTRDAYRLECDLLPMVQAMRWRGIRVNLNAAERARDLLLAKRDATLAELSDKLGCNVSMHELDRNAWLAETFDREQIKYPRTAKGNPSFKGGALGWMTKHAHWLPQLITRANKYNNAATKFLQAFILDHAVNGRIHAEIHPHRSEGNGTKSFRFSYSDPPLQQMSAHDEEISPLIRGVFLPEQGEVWAKPDAKQQEFRFVLHYASLHHLPKAAEWVQRYVENPDTDFHALTAETTKLDRQRAKSTNFAKIYGAGVAKFAEMINQSLAEATTIYNQYDANLPFLRRLASFYQNQARSRGYIELLDGARRHFNKFAPGGTWKKGLGPCELEEARARIKDPGHPWHRQQLWRVDTHTALNALIQGSAARHTKLWMRAVWRAGFVPLLQMHDSLDCSVSSPEQAETIARLCCEVVDLAVPMRCDLKYGKTWGDATHDWAEVMNSAATHTAPKSSIVIKATAVEGGVETQDASAILDLIDWQPPESADVVVLRGEFAYAGLDFRLCTHCRLPAGMDAHDDQNGGWLHPQCLNAFIDQCLVREGCPHISWAAPSSLPPPSAPQQEIPQPEPRPIEPPPAPQRGNGGGGVGNGSVPPGGSRHGPDPDELPDAPFDDSALIRQGYLLKQVYPYTLADGCTVLYRQDRYELRPDLEPHKKRPPKRFLVHREVNGRDVFGAGARQVIYNWPAVMRAGPGATVIVTEGEKNADGLIKAGLLATTVLSHKWAPECVTALSGCHLIILEDHDETGRTNAADARCKLRPVAASLRVVPYQHLWNRLDPATRGPEPKAHEDVSDWIGKGGNPATLIQICRDVLIEGARLNFIDTSHWDAEPAPEQDWAVYNRIPLRQVTLFSGHGGAGKSTVALHLCAAHTIAHEWLGVVPEQGPAMFIDAEDDVRVIQRRAKALSEHFDTPIDEMTQNGLRLVTWLGEDAVLATVSKRGKIEPTPRYHGLIETAGDLKPKLIGIASSANVFAGNENDRGQVQQFVGMLTRVALVADAAVVLISHASLTGLATDTGLSGTTQWHNSVRARFWQREVKPPEGEPINNDLREIVFKKNQYGLLEESIVLRWTNGLYLPVPGVTIEQVEREALARDVFLTLLRRFRSQNRNVSDKPSSTYAPTVFAQEPEAQSAGLSKKNLAVAMSSLFRNEVIWNEPTGGKPSRNSYHIAIK